MEKKWAFVFGAFLFIPALGNLQAGFWKFYLLRLDKGRMANGVIATSSYEDGDPPIYVVGYRYQVGGVSYSATENLSIQDTTVKYPVGKEVDVTYNIKRPWHGTIDPGENLAAPFMAAVLVFAWLAWSCFMLIREGISLLRKRFTPIAGSGRGS